MTIRRVLRHVIVIAALTGAGCGRPDVNGLRDSFAHQLSLNRAVKDLQRNGDDLVFSGPGIEGDLAKWRIHIDSAVIETTDDKRARYKGVVKSSWYANEQIVRPSGNGRESNLPIALTAHGLAQDCWALWDEAGKKWSWE
jgi:hypothetical protein